MTSAVLTFVSAFFIEVAFVFWFRFAAAGKAVHASLLSGAIATAQIAGWLELVGADRWKSAAGLIVGYMLGAFVAVSWSKRTV